MQQPHWRFLIRELGKDIVKYIIEPMVTISEEMVKANYDEMLQQLEYQIAENPIRYYVHHSIDADGKPTNTAWNCREALKPAHQYAECFKCLLIGGLWCNCDMREGCKCMFICQLCRQHMKFSVARARCMRREAGYKLPRDQRKLDGFTDDCFDQQLQLKKRHSERLKKLVDCQFSS